MALLFYGADNRDGDDADWKKSVSENCYVAFLIINQNHKNPWLLEPVLGHDAAAHSIATI